MLRSMLVSAALAAGCGVPEPLNREVDAPSGADQATAIVVAEWSERLPHADGLSMADLPPIRWFAGECLDYGDHCPLGAYVESYWGDSEIHLLIANRRGLAHESLHWALDELGEYEPVNSHRHSAWRQVRDVAALLTGPF